MKSKNQARRGKNQAPAKKAIPAPPARLEWWIFLILAAVAFSAFARTIPYEFVYDDEFQILRNPWIRDWSNLGKILTTDVWQFRNNAAGLSNYFRPIHMLLHMVGYSLSGLKPHAFHLINIFLHCTSTILVALVGLRLTTNRRISVLAGLIFALHPIHAESISWIAAVPDVICAVFYFGAIYFYLQDRQNPHKRIHIALTLVFFYGALLSKEMAFTFPIVAACMDFCLARKLRWSRYAMIAGVFGLYTIQRIFALGKFFVQQMPLQLDFFSLMLTRFTFLATYIRKMFVPYDINAFHVFKPTTGMLTVEFALAVVTLGLLLTCAWYLRERNEALFLFAFSFLTLAPLLNLSGIGENAFADRYLYIPSLGSSLLIPIIAQWLWSLRPSSWKWSGERAATGAMAALLILFGIFLWNTIFMWSDPLTLYSETVKRSPDAVLITNSLARYYVTHNELDKAEELYSRAIKLWDNNFLKVSSNLTASYAGLGGIYYKRRNFQRAETYFFKAQELSPDTLDTLQNLGNINLAVRNYPKALEYYKRALELNPRNEVSWNNVAAYYLTTEQYDQAIEHARKALEIYPKLCEAYLVMTRAYVRKGMLPEARAAYEGARQIDASKANLVAAELNALAGSR